MIISAKQGKTFQVYVNSYSGRLEMTDYLGKKKSIALDIYNSVALEKKKQTFNLFSKICNLTITGVNFLFHLLPLTINMIFGQVLRGSILAALYRLRICCLKCPPILIFCDSLTHVFYIISLARLII